MAQDADNGFDDSPLVPEKRPGADADHTMDQSDIDALLSVNQRETIEPETLNQSALDALLSGAKGDLSPEAIEALLSGGESNHGEMLLSADIMDDTPLIPDQMEAPLAPPAPLSPTPPRDMFHAAVSEFDEPDIAVDEPQESAPLEPSPEVGLAAAISDFGEPEPAPEVGIEPLDAADDAPREMSSELREEPAEALPLESEALAPADNMPEETALEPVADAAPTPLPMEDETSSLEESGPVETVEQFPAPPEDKKSGEAKPKAEDSGSILFSQEDIEALLAEAEHEYAQEEAAYAPPDAAPATATEIESASLSDTPEEPPQEAAPPPSSEPPSGGPGMLTQEDLDALLSAVSEGGEDDGATILDSLSLSEETAAAASVTEDAPGSEISQDMIDSLIAAAAAAAEVDGNILEAPDIEPELPASGADIGSENLAAAVAPSPSDIERLTRGISAPPPAKRAKVDAEAAERRALEEAFTPQEAAPEPAPKKKEPKPRRAPKPPRQPGPIVRFLATYGPRLFFSIAGGMAVASCVALYLLANGERTPDMTEIATVETGELDAALKKAQEQLAAGNYDRTIAELKEPLAKASASATRIEAEFVMLEAMYRAGHYEPNSEAFNALIDYIDALVAEAPDHPRAPEALYWKAKLYEWEGVPYAASEVYDYLIARYATAPRLDIVLLDAAKLANAQRDPVKATEFARRLMQQFPTSPLLDEARLELGGAYALAGMNDDARTLYLRVANAQANTSVGADAYLRLGRLAFDQHRDEEAIHYLETRLDTATTTQGNDEVYLKLAQSYRRAGKLEQARDTLNDLIAFFPENRAVMLPAFIELSQVLDEMGQRDKAVLIAKEAARRYTDSPEAQRNQGDLLGLSGNAFGAAAALVAADDAGAHDPSLLLRAARYYSTAGMIDQSRRTYTALNEKYPGTPQALTGGIEQAKLVYHLGEVNTAVAQLEELAVATQNSPQRLPTLLAMSEIYSDLGLDERVSELAAAISKLTADPQSLVNAAYDIARTGNIDASKTLYEKADLTKVTPESAYKLRMTLGKGLLKLEPHAGLDMLEQAWLAYPEQRNLDDGQVLLESYLAADRPAAARAMVMELDAHVRQNSMDAPYLIDAAVAWGNFLYGRGDYRAAADAYALVEDAMPKGVTDLAGKKADPAWAKYQRANALFELGDFTGSQALYAEIAASKASWAKEAAIKAEYAKLELQRRGAKTG